MYIHICVITGVLVGAMISYMGCKIGFKSVMELTDGISEDVLERIGEIVQCEDGVRSFYSIRARRMGSHLYVDLTILVDPHISVSAAHMIAECVRHRLMTANSLKNDRIRDILIHVDSEKHKCFYDTQMTDNYADNDTSSHPNNDRNRDRRRNMSTHKEIQIHTKVEKEIDTLIHEQNIHNGDDSSNKRAQLQSHYDSTQNKDRSQTHSKFELFVPTHSYTHTEAHIRQILEDHVHDITEVTHVDIHYLNGNTNVNVTVRMPNQLTIKKANSVASYARKLLEQQTSHVDHADIHLELDDE